ncbi:MAG: prepilin-type N-terminal cleavage/methylation domain-containing protein [Sulfolobaceae archaeon]
MIGLNVSLFIEFPDDIANIKKASKMNSIIEADKYEWKMNIMSLYFEMRNKNNKKVNTNPNSTNLSLLFIVYKYYICILKLFIICIMFLGEIMKAKNGFTVFELMIVIAIILILSSISIANYISINNKARLSRAYEDLSQIAYFLELYKIDWGAYPVVPNGETFGKNTDGEILTSKIAVELTGKGDENYTNISTRKTHTGLMGGIEYVSPGVIRALYNPFNRSEDYHYRSDSAGSKWILYLELPNKKYLYRTVTQVNLVETAVLPEP